MEDQVLVRQTLALTKKNLVVAVKRKWLSTLLRSLILPIALIVLLLEIQNFTKDRNKYGYGSIHQIRDLSDTIHGSKSLVLVHNSTLGPDFAPFLERFRPKVGKANVIELTTESDIDAKCPVDYHGNSPCHAVVLFNDSPESGRVNATWKYDIRTDPALQSWSFNVYDQGSTAQAIVLPLQSAIETAMVNLTTSADIQAFTPYTQKEADDNSRKSFQITALYILSFAFFVSMVPVAQHASSMMSSERELGISHLIDAMGGNGASWARVMSYVVTFDILYLPLWIILGAVFWHLLLPGQNAATVIFWQILTGWSVTSAAVFGASFFKKQAFGSLWGTLIPVLLAVLGAYSENTITPPSVGQVIVLSLLFPSFNYVYFFSLITKAEIIRTKLDLGQILDNDELNDIQFSGQHGAKNWVSVIPGVALWVILILQIIIFPLLAILIERILYANNRKGREFKTDPEAKSSQVGVQTNGLTKVYHPSWFKKLFCCARAPKAKAVDELNLTSYRNQILCLLGPNGSGKTTTLDMLSGFQKPTAGSIEINAPDSSIGVCPQKNVLWDNLTVFEHLSIWNAVKGNRDTADSLEELIAKCDLTKKKNSLISSLSGGMKRKLQLACMLVGGSTVCFADEVTSGLDPLSRRVIWNVILSERARRTMVLTTHFLDESEVLSDHIVIITLGKMKCQGTPAELKSKFGGGYRVHIPKTEHIEDIQYPVVEQRDRYICRTPDSSSAAGIIASLKTSRESDLYITGPTIEDVFLKVAEEPHTLIGESAEKISPVDSTVSAPEREAQISAPSTMRLYARQIGALFLKRVYILRSLWWAYIFALAIPIVVSYFLGPFLVQYVAPDCDDLVGYAPLPETLQLYSLDNVALGPLALNKTATNIVQDQNDGHSYSYDYQDEEDQGPYVQVSRDALEDFIRVNGQNLSYSGGLWAPNDSTPLVAYDARSASSSSILLNLANQARSGVRIDLSSSYLTQYTRPDGGNSVIYVTLFCLVQALYPAFFALYPTYERRSQVRALQYSNGIRPLPLLLSYWMFDFAFVLIISIVCTAIISTQASWFGIGYIFLSQALYGLAATLVAYLVSLIAKSQPSAFAFSVLIMAVLYVISIVVVLFLNLDTGNPQRTLDGTAYGLGLIFPIQNLLRAYSVGLNTFIVRCRGTTKITDPGSIYTHGGPILLLIIQNIWLFVLLLWLEGGKLAFRKSKVVQEDNEKLALSGRPDVDAETARVMASNSDLLRVQHVSKSFGSYNAVDDVSLGLQEGEILALLGPNGAGKTTIINLIRGDMTPSSGKIYLQDVDVHKDTRLAQQHLGLCPQFDALDLLTVREHLHFYARCKGVLDIKADVAYVMSKVGITAHADKPAAKLSGGNKRKLSLAIALVGNPPVLVLDEPSSAMDAASKRVLWKTLQAVAPGRSVLITTHSMEEADALATRAAIIAKRLLAIGSTEALRKTHSNEYHVHLILKSAPLSTPEEMREVAFWVDSSFPNVRFEGENLGGQVRFVVPADSQVPTRDSGPVDGEVRASQSFTRYLIETLEARKESVGLECYSISAATMESVFLSVVKESDADEDERIDKKPWWKW
ncbi:hypothetical protein F5Y18DRAFT_435477 [Xylariaceae sp. FL1019]|nr:hypothetical protein F5Y18DRAFT_435477 [Xylariaceae sp. FL1019]